MHTVTCGTHGEQDATYVCQHVVHMLQDGVPRGFFWADDPENPRPDAWCSRCNELVAARGGEWDDESESFAKVTLICGGCYDAAKEINFR